MPEQAVLNEVFYDSLNEGLLVSTQAEKEAEVGEILAQMIAERPELIWKLLQTIKPFIHRTQIKCSERSAGFLYLL